MTERKAIAIIFMLILAVVLLTGCSANQPEPSKTNDPTYAMIRMPDGSIVQGLCSYMRYGYCSAVVIIDGVRYQTGAENVVVVWK
jgi:outer membrane biogenesis lipoprotein LolB